MQLDLLKSFHQKLENLWQKEDGIEFILARDLQKQLGYSNWDKFQNPIKKAINSCNSNNINEMEHFYHVERVLIVGNGAKQSVPDIKLTRYASYLIAMNGDTRKQEISYAQNYFASSTRKFELIIDRINDLERIDSREKLKEAENQLSGVLFDHGVDSKGISIIRSKGDEAFFNGRNTGSMKEQYGIKKSKPLADFTNTTINLAKALASSITSTTVKRDSIFGKEKIEKEHIKSNKQSRKALVDSGIYPEDIPPEEDIKKVASKIKKEEKALIKKNKKRR